MSFLSDPTSSMMPPMPGPMGPDMGMALPELPPEPQPYLTEELLKEYATKDPGRWSLRDKRITRHRRLYELEKPAQDRTKPYQVIAVTNDAKVIVRKMSSMIANHPPAIEVPARDPQKVKEAERVEDFLRWYREEEIYRHGDGPHGDRGLEEAEYLVRDGILVDCTTWNPNDPAFPFESCLVDPQTWYPTYAGDKLLRHTLRYRTMLGELKLLLPEDWAAFVAQNPEYQIRKDTDPVQVHKVFCQEQGQWDLGILVDGKVFTIKVLDYNPFTVSYVASRSYEINGDGTTSISPNYDKYENVGVGIFDLIEEPIKDKNRDYAMLREMAARDANPPKIFFTDDTGKVEELKFEPGANIHLWSQDKFQLVQLNPDFRKLESLLAVATQGIERGSLPAALHGEGNTTSGVQEYMVLGNARDQVYVYLRAHERFLASKYRKILELYKQFSAKLTPESPGQGMEFTARNQSGVMLAGQQFTVADIEALGGTPQVRVEYSEVTPQNEVARVQMANVTTQAKLLDLESARKLLPAPFNENPQLIGQKVLEDISLMNPLMTQILSLSAALLSPDPLVRALASMQLPSLVQQAQMAGQPGGPSPNPNGPPATPQPGVNGVPKREGDMPPGAAPAELQSQAGAPEGAPNPPPPGSSPRPF